MKSGKKILQLGVRYTKICFFCDLHLPFERRALQYDVLEWAIGDIGQKSPDCVVFAGDATCDGNAASFDYFINAVQKLNIPFLYIPGNSDLRCRETRDAIRRYASPGVSLIGGAAIYAINDCDGTVSPEQLSLLDGAAKDSIVFMHHPLQGHDAASAAHLLEWRKKHPDTAVFYGHLHCFSAEACSMALPAMDPDKSIGEAPCMVYYDTVTKAFCKAHYPVSVPEGLAAYFGISCYQPLEHIQFAAKKHLKCLELRPNCAAVDRRELAARIAQWRLAGGEKLSVHLPDVGYANGAVTFDAQYDEVLEIVSLLQADRVTQHVPKASVGTIEKGHRVLEEICEALAEKFNRLPQGIVIGVENMHMNPNERADETRRFGYTPEECIRYRQMLQERCRHRVGFNFDIGHARNNMPYSQRYQISTWLSMLGEHIVGYHMHQVANENGRFENHMPITQIYGSLISLASFLKCWETGKISRVPIIFEMRPQGAYEKTLATFEACVQPCIPPRLGL